jgi:hypothetical protein
LDETLERAEIAIRDSKKLLNELRVAREKARRIPPMEKPNR